MQLGVHGRFLDQAASVREAAVDLIGRFVLDKPQLTLQYYPMLSERILDKAVGVGLLFSLINIVGSKT